MAFLKKTPAENGVPRHFMTVDFRPAKGIPSSFDGFRAAIGRQGFDHAAEVLAAIQKDKPEFKFDDGALYEWSQELISDKHLPEAIELLKLNCQISSGAGGAFDDLAEAYLKAGQTQLAIDSFRKALDKDAN